MRIYISVKEIKKRGNRIQPLPWELPETPETLRQLIIMLVSGSVAGYNRRLETKEQRVLLLQEDMDDMSTVGKIGFGIPFCNRRAKLSDAVETALQGFEDGLYRVFAGEREVESLDAPLALEEGDTVTLIRLVMLTGGYF